MTHSEFAWWLHGFTEITHGAQPTPAQWQTIVDHLDLTFNKVTPNRFGSQNLSYPALSGVIPAKVDWYEVTGCGTSPIKMDGLICGGVPLKPPTNDVAVLARGFNYIC